tara:strand:+ start:55005 stop:55196 length:192 start_codon:yes stop_codon:yes gene_type:complete
LLGAIQYSGLIRRIKMSDKGAWFMPLFNNEYCYFAFKKGLNIGGFGSKPKFFVKYKSIGSGSQ